MQKHKNKNIYIIAKLQYKYNLNVCFSFLNTKIYFIQELSTEFVNFFNL